MKLGFLRLSAAVSICLGMAQASTVYGGPSASTLFFTPAPGAVPEVIAAIKGARTSIHMFMYNLTEPTAIDELIAAHSRGVDVKVILDLQNATREKPTGAFHRLTEANVTVLKSSSAFALSHVKTFVVDGSTAYIMSINLTKISDRVRDAAYVTDDPNTIRFIEDLFTLDIKNAAASTNLSPATIPDNIVVSPANSRSRLESLINSAHRTLKVTVENLSDTVLINDLIAQQKNGVKVQVMMPRCDMTSNDFDLPAARLLAAGGIDVRMMPAPMSSDLPYIHQKSIIVDENNVFLGSENFSFNSLDNCRELGVIFSDVTPVQQMVQKFNEDFAKSLDMAASETFKCPAKPFDNGYSATLH